MQERTAPLRIPSIHRQLAFALGAGMSILPAIGPFAATVLVFVQRWTFRRSDAVWLASALLLGSADLFRGDFLLALTAIATVAGPWVVYRTFGQLQVSDNQHGLRRALAAGLVVGFASTIAYGLYASIVTFDLGSSLTFLDALEWRDSSAVFGHVVVTVGGLIALFTRQHRRLAFLALALTALGVLISGNLEAALAWIVLAGAYAFTGPRTSTTGKTLEFSALAGVAITAVLVSPSLGWGNIGFTLSPESVEDSRNLFRGTEQPNGDWWDDHWVSVRTESVVVAGASLIGYEVTKRTSEPWERLQQRVALQPNTTYTLSGWIDTTAAEATGVYPGFQGYGRLDSAPTADMGSPALVLTSTWRDGLWGANVSGPGTLISSEILEASGPWTRVSVAFSTHSDTAIEAWYVGFAPHASSTPQGTARFAGLMLETSDTASSYVPGTAASGLSFGYARAPLWRAAWELILVNPWVGWGSGTFSDAYATTRQGVERQEFVPAHPHNMFLTVLYERGIVGLAGLILILIALFGVAIRRGDAAFLLVLLAVATLNIFDATLLLGGIMYPLAAAAGWRNSDSIANAHESSGRQIGVRLTLALTDISAAMMGLGVAFVVAPVFSAQFEVVPVLLYVTAALPALSWREGLYPGYGLTPQQELKKQISVWVLAGGLIIVGRALFMDAFVLPWIALSIWLGVVLLLIPLARSVTKRILYAFGLWGRPVLILGAGSVGQRTARSLQRTHLDGLNAMAFFDDDESLHGTEVQSLPVRGSLEDSIDYARTHGVQHIIVAIPALAWQRLDSLVSGHGDVLRWVQYIPRLGTLPSEDVVVSDLDGMLALEIRNGLYAPYNRIAKRLADLLLASIGIVVISPILLLIGLLVRLDSPGGALHRSERIGQGGRAFACLKFRTMFEDAEERLAILLASNPALKAEYEEWHKLDNDPRITRLGRFLRRSSLDELPQVWNVLVGDMSVVGPRPYLRRELSDMGRFAGIIFQAKPGITGHWQVTGRNDVTFSDRLEMEAHYIRNWSIWWDIILLFQTPLALLQRRTAAK